jgi:hypothetical protein
MVESDGTSELVEQFELLHKQFDAEYLVNHYLVQARLLVDAEVTEKTNPDLLALIGHCKSALMAIEANDINNFAYNFHWALQLGQKVNITTFQAQGVSIFQTEKAQKDRRPQLPKRAVLCALRAGCETKTEVENFLNNQNQLSDKWGHFEIESVDGDFHLTDIDRNFKDKTLKTARLASIISDLKK